MVKVLIIDDSLDLREVLSLLLERKGYEVRGISSGVELHGQLSVFAPDVIFLDVRLQHEDGREICKEIKANRLLKHIKVILISASSIFLENHLECEADAVIEKPFNISTVYETIEKVLLEKNYPV